MKKLKDEERGGLVTGIISTTCYGWVPNDIMRLQRTFLQKALDVCSGKVHKTKVLEWRKPKEGEWFLVAFGMEGEWLLGAAGMEREDEDRTRMSFTAHRAGEKVKQQHWVLEITNRQGGG